MKRKMIATAIAAALAAALAYGSANAAPEDKANQQAYIAKAVVHANEVCSLKAPDRLLQWATTTLKTMSDDNLQAGTKMLNAQLAEIGDTGEQLRGPDSMTVERWCNVITSAYSMYTQMYLAPQGYRRLRRQ